MFVPRFVVGVEIGGNPTIGSFSTFQPILQKARDAGECRSAVFSAPLNVILERGQATPAPSFAPPLSFAHAAFSFVHDVCILCSHRIVCVQASRYLCTAEKQTPLQKRCLR